MYSSGKNRIQTRLLVLPFGSILAAYGQRFIYCLILQKLLLG
jgi:hypothetical protein